MNQEKDNGYGSHDAQGRQQKVPVALDEACPIIILRDKETEMDRREHHSHEPESESQGCGGQIAEKIILRKHGDNEGEGGPYKPDRDAVMNPARKGRIMMTKETGMW